GAGPASTRGACRSPVAARSGRPSFRRSDASCVADRPAAAARATLSSSAMKIGTRITLTTVTLVLLTLGLYGWVSLRTRRAELNTDLERQMELVGASVRVALDAAEQEGLYEDTRKLVVRWQNAEPNIRFTYFDIAH